MDRIAIALVSGMAGARCSGRAIIGLNAANLVGLGAVSTWKQSLIEKASFVDMLNPTGDLALSEIANYTQIGFMCSGAYWLYRRLPKNDLNKHS